MFTAEYGFLKKVHKLIDILILVSSFILAYFLKKYFLPVFGYSGLAEAPSYYVVLAVLIIGCYCSFDFVGFYDSFRHNKIHKVLSNTFKGVVLGYSVMMIFLYIIKAGDISRIMLGLAFSFTFLALSLSKIAALFLLNNRNIRNVFQTNILIIGSKQQAAETIKAITENSTNPVNIIGCLDTDKNLIGKTIHENFKVTGLVSDYFEVLKTKAVDEVIFAMPPQLIENVKEYINYAEQVGVNIRFIPNWQIKQLMYKPETATTYFDQKIGIPTIVLSSKPQKEAGLFFKSLLDYIVSATMVIFISPLLLAIAAAVKMTSDGPVFFKQERSGLGGRKFQVLKFRTMVVDAESLRGKLMDANEVDGPVFKIAKDPRITKVGSFLRKTSLDELPQLINVLKGEMSLVGPRPPIPAEVEQYETWQRRRLSMKPGLTCIWQVSGRNNVDFKSWMKMDLAYIDKWSIWLDLKLLCLTIPTVLFGTGK